MRRKKKRPELNTNKTKGSAFFPGIQKKLAISKANDSYEVEADKMAGTVVNSGESKNIQKKDAPEEEVQQKPLAESISSVQKKSMPAEEKTIQKKDKEE